MTVIRLPVSDNLSFNAITEIMKLISSTSLKKLPSSALISGQTPSALSLARLAQLTYCQLRRGLLRYSSRVLSFSRPADFRLPVFIYVTASCLYPIASQADELSIVVQREYKHEGELKIDLQPAFGHHWWMYAKPAGNDCEVWGGHFAVNEKDNIIENAGDSYEPIQQYTFRPNGEPPKTKSVKLFTVKVKCKGASAAKENESIKYTSPGGDLLHTQNVVANKRRDVKYTVQYNSKIDFGSISPNKMEEKNLGIVPGANFNKTIAKISFGPCQAFTANTCTITNNAFGTIQVTGNNGSAAGIDVDRTSKVMVKGKTAGNLQGTATLKLAYQ